MVKSRLINVLVGCVIGLTFLLVGGSSAWKLPFVLSVAVLVSSYVVRVQTMWRQAPITAAIVIAESLTQHSRLTCRRANERTSRRLLTFALEGPRRRLRPKVTG